ncbi:MAG: MlaD family protein [Saprospiraceae bacterium]|nr:MlaD family protein [Saprospiraceae bacterium]
MKIRNEIKVGILSIVTIFLLIWGYNFLKGKNILTNNTIIKAKFDTVDGLAISAPVTINGLRVGAVTEIDIVPRVVTDKNGNKLKNRANQDSVMTVAIATLSINKDYKVPKKVVPELYQPSLLSGKEVALRFEGSCDAGNCFESGSEVDGRIPGMLDGIMETAGPILDTIGSKAEPILEGLSGLGGSDGALADVGVIVDNVKLITDQVNSLLLNASSNLSSTMNNLNAITGNIKQSNDDITALLQNLNALSKDLKDSDISGTVAEAKATIANLNATIKQLPETLNGVNKAVSNITDLTDFSSKEGVISSLLYDADFDKEIKMTVKDLRLLMQDLRLHPERYRTVLSNKKKKYKPTPTENDPGHNDPE